MQKKIKQLEHTLKQLSVRRHYHVPMDAIAAEIEERLKHIGGASASKYQGFVIQGGTVVPFYPTELSK